MRWISRLLLAALLALLPALTLADAESETGEDELALTLREMRTLTDVLGHLQRDYVEETRDSQLLENAIRGMLEGLDKHTVYLDREEYARLEDDTRGRYGGIGVEVDWRDGTLQIVGVTDGGPADQAGVAVGDVVLAVAGEAVSPDRANTALDQVRGRPGTEVTLTISRDGVDREVTMVREVIRITSVYSNLLEGDLAYLKLNQFQTRSAEQVLEQLDQLSVQAAGPLRGLVLDLRGNPGGVLTAAVGLADLFLESGLIVSTRGRREDRAASYSAAPGDELGGAPIVVLVDEASASASEIVAGALQDHGRALVLGEKTFGKGSVQTVLPLRNGGAIKLTTSLYYTPSGRAIQDGGIEPDIALDPRPGTNGIDQALLEATRLVRNRELAQRP